MISAPLLLAFGAAAIGVRWSQPVKDDPAGPLPYRTKLVETLKKESAEEALANLANYDDYGWVSGGLSGGGIVPMEAYTAQRSLIPSLNRVRRFLEHIQQGPDAKLAGRLMERLQSSAAGYEKALQEVNDKHRKAGGGFESSEPDDFDRCLVIGPASIYLLSEMQTHQAMPLMAKVYEDKRKLPFSRLYLYYAMHRLAVSHPTDGLSAAAVAALRTYKEKARDIPPPEVKVVPAWDDGYEETDFRTQILKQDLSGRYKRTQKVTYYPHELGKYEIAIVPQLSPEIDELFGALKAFIDKAYP